jgi:hypothetical protein
VDLGDAVADEISLPYFITSLALPEFSSLFIDRQTLTTI